MANDSFVWFGVNHAIGAFGDYTALNVNPTPVIFGSQSTTISDRQMSTNLSHSQSCFFNHAKQSMFLRSFNGLNGFTLSTSGATYQTNYGDSQGVHLVRYVDVMTRENDKYSVQGYMPHLLYCDVLLENGDLTPQNKKIYQSPVLSGTGKLLFEVDEL